MKTKCLRLVNLKANGRITKRELKDAAMRAGLVHVDNERMRPMPIRYLDTFHKYNTVNLVLQFGSHSNQCSPVSNNIKWDGVEIYCCCLL